MWLKEIFGAKSAETHRIVEAAAGDETVGGDGQQRLSDGCFCGAVGGEALLPARIISPTWRRVRKMPSKCWRRLSEIAG